VVSRTTSPHITSCTLLVGDGEFHVEVGKGELNQFVLVSHERVQDTVDVGVVVAQDTTTNTTTYY